MCSTLKLQDTAPPYILNAFKTYLGVLEGSWVRTGICVLQGKTLWQIGDLSLAHHLPWLAGPGYLLPGQWDKAACGGTAAVRAEASFLS